MTKKLYKSRTDVKIDGVCSGIANYFGISVTLVRFLFVLTAFIDLLVPTLIIYIVLCFITPREPEVLEVEYMERLQ